MSVEQINRVCREETSTRRIEKKGEREIDGRMCVYICERIPYRLCWTTTKACWSAQHTHGPR